MNWDERWVRSIGASFLTTSSVFSAVNGSRDGGEIGLRFGEKNANILGA
jgi:hypothetical protein